MKASLIAAWSFAALIVIGLVAAVLYGRSVQPQLELGTAYAARVACACRYIGMRTLASCRADFEPGMEPISLEDDPATKTVTAYVPLIAHRSVRYDPLLGCQPEPFRGTVLKVKP